MLKQYTLVLVVLAVVSIVQGFVPVQLPPTTGTKITTLFADPAATAPDTAATDLDPNEIIGRRIIVKGDVNGGYYRSCVLNEAGRFRRLVGTMTPPDSSDRAEIYVEGKRKMVEGFIRWCKRGNVGLNQVTGVDEIVEEEPTGLYDGFYCKTH